MRPGGGTGGNGMAGGPMSLFMDEPLQQERIRVCLRIRPINKLEQSRRSRSCMTVPTDDADGNGLGSAISVDSPLEGEFKFMFDKVSAIRSIWMVTNNRCVHYGCHSICFSCDYHDTGGM